MIVPLTDDIGSAVGPRGPVGGLSRFRYFVRRHPVAAGSGLLVCVAAILLGLFSMPAQRVGWDEPRSVLPNVNTGKLEVHGSGGELLWAIPSLVLASANTSDYHHFTNLMSQVALVDLDGDGRKEVITTLALRQEEIADSLRVFRGDGSPAWAIGFDRVAPSTIRSYPTTNFHPGSLLVRRRRDARESEVFVACGLTYSPVFIARVDGRGNELGTYWHFGALQIRAVDFDRDGSGEILAYGIDDTNDDSRTEFPFVALLDPERIAGDHQSTATPVFRLGFSTAEKFYVGVELSDMFRVLGSNAGAVSFEHAADTTFQVDVVGNYKVRDSYLPAFAYYFNQRMEVVEVKSKNPTTALHEQLRAEGRINSVMGPEYLEQLRRGVRYWDGRAWRGEPTRVQHSAQSPANGSR